ncbi:MAG TPA: methyltransferase domain-containing protein [Thermoanaerobaculia bacterium]|jgi:predicted SAM-dependent methyltransferase|nr:methyltransferase domain-containing protein [Thermoanaerobaculia bacterium]
MKTKLHVGSGPVLLEGWINVDNQPYRGIDQVLDIREGIPYSDLEYIFAEHFIEHLAYDDAMKFLRDCRRALGDGGVLRLTTPNLDWVWMTQYHLGQWSQPSEAVRDCFWMNKAFRGWGHQFLYNAQTLTECLHDAGFATIERCAYGESRHEALRGVEHHEKYLDSPELPHLIVVEASGRQRRKSDILEGPRDEFRAAVSVV